MSASAIPLLHAPDRKRLVATVANFLFEHGGNNLDADQHQDVESGPFFMSIQWSLQDFHPDQAGFTAHLTLPP